MGKLASIILLIASTSIAFEKGAIARPEPDRSRTYAIPVDGFPSDGPADAKVTLVIAHDYADPFSERNRSTLDELRKRYGNDLRIVFRNMVVHPRNAMAGALASCAAHKQKKFDLMEDKLWEAFRQRQWDLSEVDLGNGPQKCWDTPDGCTNVVGFARDLGLRMDRFRTDMQDCVSIVAADMAELQTFAVGATPTFFINGRYLAGAMPTPDFEKLIDEELTKANDRIKAGTPRARYYKTFVIDRGEKKVDPTAAGSGAPAYTPPTRPEPDRSKNYAVPVDGYPSRGAADAKVTIVMIADYASPYAEKTRSTMDDLFKHYGNDLRVVYRTRLVHPSMATAASLAACAAHKQSRFAAMDTLLWDKGFKGRAFDASDIDDGQGNRIKCWDSPTSCTNVVGFAKEANLDIPRFKADLKSCVKTVEADDREISTTFQVNATPGFFINGRFLSGAMPRENFEALIDEELVKANDKIKSGTPRNRYYKTWIVDKGEKRVDPTGAAPYQPPTAPQPPTPMPRPARPEPDRALAYAVPVDGYPSIGPADAKVTMVVIRDYATPYAERNRSTLEELIKKYGNDLRLVFRTRLVHPNNAHAAALAACAAHKQRKFVAMDSILWDKGFKERRLDLTDVDDGQGNRHKCWDDPNSCTNAIDFAKEVGLDVPQFKADLKACVKPVEADDTELGQTFQVNATPGFFINGRFMSGAWPTPEFEKLIDEELTKANGRIKAGTPRGSYYKTWILGKGIKRVTASP